MNPYWDSELEGDETVDVSLSSDSYYTIGTAGSATVTIADAPLPLMAAAPALGPAGTHDSLTAAQLEPAVDRAIDFWAQESEAAEVARLREIELSIADLPGLTLGLASWNRVTIDVDGAGHGWGGAGGMDLGRVVTHEFGHHLGLPDLDAHDHPHDVMAGTLHPNSLPSRAAAPPILWTDDLFADNPGHNIAGSLAALPRYAQNQSHADPETDRQTVARLIRTDQEDLLDLVGGDVRAIDAVLARYGENDLTLIDLLAADSLFDPNEKADEIVPAAHF